MNDDSVSHPSHYGGDNPYEVIKVLEAWLSTDEYRGALKFNIHKYLARADKKGGIEDLHKAHWYLKELIRFDGLREAAHERLHRHDGPPRQPSNIPSSYEPSRAL